MRNEDLFAMQDKGEIRIRDNREPTEHRCRCAVHNKCP